MDSSSSQRMQRRSATMVLEQRYDDATTVVTRFNIGIIIANNIAICSKSNYAKIIGGKTKPVERMGLAEFFS